MRHHAAAQAARREAALQAAGRTEAGHAAGVPAAVHVRVRRMQAAGQVTVLSCKIDRAGGLGHISTGFYILIPNDQNGQGCGAETYPWTSRSRR